MSQPPAGAPVPEKRRRERAVGAAAEEAVRQVPWQSRLAASLLNGLAQCIGATLRFQFENEGALRAREAEGMSAIAVTWHGRIFIPVYHYRRRGYCALVSLSRDGDLIAEVLRRAGFRTVRGSTSRGSLTATRDVLGVLRKGGIVVLVPDGPRGPSRKVQPGVVYFAQRSGCPIIPVGISAWPRWLARSWDRFMIPYPFARAVWLYGDPITVGPDEDLETAARRVEQVMLALEAEAERRVVPEGRRV